MVNVIWWKNEKNKRIKIILVSDNATSYPDSKLRNMNLVIFPSGTTSHC